MYKSFIRSPRKATLNVVLVAAVGISLLSGCSSEAAGPMKTQAVQRAEISYPKTAVAAESAWVLQQLNEKKEMTASVWEPKLSKLITSEMSAAELVSSLNTDIRPQGPFTLVEFTQEDKTGISTLQLADLSTMELSVTIEEGGKISGIFFK